MNLELTDMATAASVSLAKGNVCLWGLPHLAPALRLVGVKELLSIREAAYTDLINSTHIKLLCHEGLCCLWRSSMERRWKD